MSKIVDQEVNGGHVEDKKQNMSDIEVPHPPEKPRGSNKESPLQYHGPKHQGRRITGNEYEQICSIAEAVISRRPPRKGRVGNMTKENGPVRQATQQIETQIARQW
jgi:hypothetical protein